MEDNTFSITPMSQSISLNPGETYTGSIKIVNHINSKDDLHYKISVSPYGVVGEEYTADLSTKTGRNEIVDWIKIEEPSGVIKPNESKEVKYKVNVPKEAPSGGQYATIAVSSDPENKDGDMISNVFELASVVYAQVAGENKREGKILSNTVPEFSFVPDVDVTASIENTGNIHDYAIFAINVKNFFTGEMIYTADQEDGEFSEIIMPETTREVRRGISNLPSLGIVHISQQITYNGEQSIVEKNLIICPWWFLLLVLLTIGAIIAVIVRKVKRASRMKRGAGDDGVF